MFYGLVLFLVLALVLLAPGVEAVDWYRVEYQVGKEYGISRTWWFKQETKSHGAFLNKKGPKKPPANPRFLPPDALSITEKRAPKEDGFCLVKFKTEGGPSYRCRVRHTDLKISFCESPNLGAFEICNENFEAISGTATIEEEDNIKFQTSVTFGQGGPAPVPAQMTFYRGGNSRKWNIKKLQPEDDKPTLQVGCIALARDSNNGNLKSWNKETACKGYLSCDTGSRLCRIRVEGGAKSIYRYVAGCVDPNSIHKTIYDKMDFCNEDLRLDSGDIDMTDVGDAGDCEDPVDDQDPGTNENQDEETNKHSDYQVEIHPNEDENTPAWHRVLFITKQISYIDAFEPGHAFSQRGSPPCGQLPPREGSDNELATKGCSASISCSPGGHLWCRLDTETDYSKIIVDQCGSKPIPGLGFCDNGPIDDILDDVMDES